MLNLSERYYIQSVPEAWEVTNQLVWDSILIHTFLSVTNVVRHLAYFSKNPPAAVPWQLVVCSNNSNVGFFCGPDLCLLYWGIF